MIRLRKIFAIRNCLIAFHTEGVAKQARQCTVKPTAVLYFDPRSATSFRSEGHYLYASEEQAKHNRGERKQNKTERYTLSE